MVWMAYRGQTSSMVSFAFEGLVCSPNNLGFQADFKNYYAPELFKCRAFSSQQTHFPDHVYESDHDYGMTTFEYKV
jgi:hypothetical protein